VEPVLQALSESDNPQLVDLVKQKDPDVSFAAENNKKTVY
jgi:hypothetical protein